MCTADWLPSTSTGMPRACAMRMISLTGTTVPSTFDMCVMATILVRGLISCSNSSSRNSPSSDDRRPLQHRALALAQEVPRHDVGVVLHDREHDLVALADLRAAEGLRDEVDGLGGVAGEDDLVVGCAH